MTGAPVVILGGTVNAFQAALPYLLRRGTGGLIAISSELALAGSATDLHYVAAKGAVLGLVKSLALEVAGTGIRVNAVAPGPTDTPLLAPDSLWRERGYLATLPLRRLVTPQEVASTVYYLATEGADGHRVAVNDVAREGRLRELAEEIGGVAVPGDSADQEATAAIVAAVDKALGPVQVLVANAADMAMSPFLDADPARWWRQVEVNLSGHFRLIQAVIGGMRALGHGQIIVIASGWGVIGHPNATAYAASKSGLIALTKGLGRELGPDGILANAIAPAFIDTEQLMVDAADAGISLEEMRQRYRDLVPVGQLATTDDIAAAISFLAGPGATGFVGQVLQPTGGVTRTRA